MIDWFVFSLASTLIIVRILSHTLHDRKNYGTPLEKSRTFTSWLRKNTGFDWHHIHIGFILTILATIAITIKGFNIPYQIILGAGLSMIADQILPLVTKINYFSKKMLLWAIIFHILIIAVSIIY